MKKYVAFVGLNDQTSKMQEISTLDAFKICSNFAREYVGFGTISEARGVYTHDDGSIVEEITLRCEFCDCTLESVTEFCKAVKTALNQESIALETQDVNFNFV